MPTATDRNRGAASASFHPSVKLRPSTLDEINGPNESYTSVKRTSANGLMIQRGMGKLQLFANVSIPELESQASMPTIEGRSIGNTTSC